MGIAKDIAEIGQHAIHDTGITRRCGLIVQIDRTVWAVDGHCTILSRRLIRMGHIFWNQAFRHGQIGVHEGIDILLCRAPTQTDPDR